MAYNKTQWENRNPQVPINDANLNKIEEGIRTAHVTADQGTSDNTILSGRVDGHDADIVDLWTDSTTQNLAILVNESDITILESYNTWRALGGADPGVTALNEIDNVLCQFTSMDGTAVELILPEVASNTAQVRIIDAGQGFDTKPVKIQRNGWLIMGTPEDLYLTTLNQSITLVFSGNDYGWVIQQSTP